jgi:orotate phosphoribosyltransferase
MSPDSYDLSDLSTDELETQVADYILDHSFRYQPENPLELSSGKTSPAYVNLRNLWGVPEAKQAVIELLGRRYEEIAIDYDVFCGEALGGVPFNEILAWETDLPTAVHRSEEKDHGVVTSFEGAPIGGQLVLAADDVVTTGGSLEGLVNDIEANGGETYHALVVVDREEGGQERLGDYDVDIVAGLTLENILDRGLDTNHFRDDEVEVVETYLDGGDWEALV